jgi:glycosyltransferase involved in cell wall biosynthesis
MGTSKTRSPISVCIPTKDRPEELKRCLESILNQNFLPTEIIIIDDGNLDSLFFKKIIEPHIVFKYFKKDKPNLSASKNLAKNLASNDLILIVDDDTVLERDYLQNIFNILNNDIKKEIGIIGGSIINSKKRSLFKKIYMRVFLLDNGKPGRLLPWGFQTGFNGIYEDTLVEWISGGISCFRREVLEEFSFEEFHGGRNVFEDIEYGYKVSKRYKLIVTPKARLYHFHSPNREGMFITGFKETYNRCWIFNKHCEKNFINIILFWWAMIGFILGMTGMGRFKMALGNLKGIISFYLLKPDADIKK